MHCNFSKRTISTAKLTVIIANQTLGNITYSSGYYCVIYFNRPIVL